MEMALTVREMSESDLDSVCALIDIEGWPFKRDMMIILRSIHPDGFFVLETPSGEVKGTVSVIPTFPHQFIVGFFVVDQSYRKKGYGRMLLEAAMKSRPSNSGYSLTSEPEALQFYLKFGFKLYAEEQIQVLTHIIVNHGKMDSIEKLLEKRPLNVTAYCKNDYLEVKSYTDSICGYDMDSYLQMAVKVFDFFLARNSDGRVVGVICSSIFRGKIALEGVLADSDWIALSLFRKMLERYPGNMRVMVQRPQCQPFLSSLGEVTNTEQFQRLFIGASSDACQSVSSSVYNVFNPGYTC